MVATANGAEQAERTIEIPALRRQLVEVRIEGVTALIVNRYSEAKREAMEKAQGGAARVKKAPREPEREFRDAQYRLPDGGHGFPAIGMKKAMVLAGQRLGGETGTVLYGVLTIPQEFLVIESPNPPEMRVDRVVLSGQRRETSIAYRPAYFPWAMTVPIRYAANFVTLDQVVNLITLAGFSVGLGDWRVDKKGTFGQWDVTDVREVRFGD